MKKGKSFLKRLLSLAAAVTLIIGLASLPAAAQTVSYSNTESVAGKGSISITNPTKGQSYSVYKLFDATVSDDGKIAYTGTIPEALNSVFETISGTTNNIQVKSTAVDTNGNFTDAATKTITDYVKTLTSATATATSNGTAPLTFDKLPYGYYAVTSGLGAVVTIDSTRPYAIINDKNDSNPTAEKKIVKETTADGKTTTELVDNITVGEGDTVKFQITVNAKNYDEDGKLIYQYVITDMPTNLDIDDSSIEVKVTEQPATTGGSATTTTLTKATTDNSSNDGHEKFYTVTKTDGDSELAITIPWGTRPNSTSTTTTDASEGTVATNAGTSYYSGATTSTTADDGTTTVTGTVITITYEATLKDVAAKNNFKLSWNSDETIITPPGTTVHAAVFRLTKVDKDTKAPLSGAEFELYANDTPTTDGATDTKVFVTQKTDAKGNKIAGVFVADVTALETDENKSATITTDDNGNFTIEGLEQNTKYYLQETKAPDGYTLPTSRIELKGTEKEDSTQVLYYNANVENTKGTELPSTGGIGTTIFYVIGGVLVVGAVVILIARKRRNA